MGKFLLISAFILSGAHHSFITGLVGKDCDGMKASYEVIADGGRSTVTVKAEGGTVPYKYIFYRESGNLLTEAFDSNSVGDLQKGKYYCTISDSKSCRKTIEIEIK